MMFQFCTIWPFESENSKWQHPIPPLPSPPPQKKHLYSPAPFLNAFWQLSQMLLIIISRIYDTWVPGTLSTSFFFSYPGFAIVLYEYIHKINISDHLFVVLDKLKNI
jgi:hypothetical protein